MVFFFFLSIFQEKSQPPTHYDSYITEHSFYVLEI